MAGIIQKAARRFTTQIGAAGVPDAVTTTIPLVSVTGLPTDTQIEVVIDRTDASGNLTPAKEEVVRGTVSGTNLINCIRGVEGTAQTHSAGAVVNSILTASMWNQMSQYIIDIGQIMYPIGSIYTSVINTNPNTYFGGTWVAFGSGRTLVGVDAGQTEFDTVEETGGAKTHTLTTNEMPSHTHIQDSHNHTQNSHTHLVYHAGSPSYYAGTGDQPGLDAVATLDPGLYGFNGNSQATTATNQATTATNQNTGGGAAHNNLQPYITVYFWKRTA